MYINNEQSSSLKTLQVRWWILILFQYCVAEHIIFGLNIHIAITLSLI